MIYLIALPLAFIAGVCVGVEIRLLGYAQGMTSLARRLAPRLGAPSRRTWGTLWILAIIATLLFNGSVGLLSIQTRAASKDIARISELRSVCNAKQFAKLVDALNDRDDRAKVQTSAAISLWVGIRAGIRHQDLSGPHLVTDIDQYIGQLHGAQSTRRRAAYPDPNLCREIR